MPFSDLKSGWLLEKHGRVGKDLTAEYKALCAKCTSGNESLLLAKYNVDRIVILLVPGLFTNHYPGYMKENINRLRKLGLDARKAKVRFHFANQGDQSNFNELPFRSVQMCLLKQTLGLFAISFFKSLRKEKKFSYLGTVRGLLTQLLPSPSMGYMNIFARFSLSKLLMEEHLLLT